MLRIGLAVLANMDQEHVLDAAIAAAHLLQPCSELAPVLLRLGTLQQLAQAALQEACDSNASLQGAVPLTQHDPYPQYATWLRLLVVGMTGSCG